MSNELDVGIGQPVEIGYLLTRGRMALEEVLALQAIPKLKADKLEHGIRSPLVSGLLGGTSHGVIVGIEGHEDEVGLTAYSTRGRMALGEEARDDIRMSISVFHLLSPLEYALAASIAIAAARIAKASIEDGEGLWSPELEQDPDSFLERVRAKGKYRTLQEAAAAMFNSLPIAKSRVPQ